MVIRFLAEFGHTYGCEDFSCISAHTVSIARRAVIISCLQPNAGV